jgi:hypothetical protein
MTCEAENKRLVVTLLLRDNREKSETILKPVEWLCRVGSTGE